MISTLSRVWHCVRPILCNDAPEGHVPEDLDPESDVNTKDILSYCWRALKEARYDSRCRFATIADVNSSLIQSLVLRAPISDRNEQTAFVGLEEQDLQELVTLAFKQLTELRHRGAFSAVAQGFAACCSRCTRYKYNKMYILESFYAVR